MTFKLRKVLSDRRWRERNPEKVLQHGREGSEAWRKKYPERNRRSQATQRRDHPEKRRASCALWRALYPERAAAIKRAWAKEHPDKRLTHDRRRRARVAQASGTFNTEQFRALGDVCLCCKRSENELILLGLRLVPDHVIPLVKGGSNYISNIQPLCHGRNGCNNHKGTKIVDYRSSNA